MGGWIKELVAYKPHSRSKVLNEARGSYDLNGIVDKDLQVLCPYNSVRRTVYCLQHAGRPNEATTAA